MIKYPGIKWSSSVQYVDIDTGEILTQRIAKDKTKYIIIKNLQHVRLNALKTKGYCEYTALCKKTQQGSLF